MHRLLKFAVLYHFFDLIRRMAFYIQELGIIKSLPGDFAAASCNK